MDQWSIGLQILAVIEEFTNCPINPEIRRLFTDIYLTSILVSLDPDFPNAV